MKSETSKSGGVSFVGLLTIAFVVLKLCHVISWRWVWVLSPIWIAAAIGLIILIYAICKAILEAIR